MVSALKMLHSSLYISQPPLFPEKQLVACTVEMLIEKNNKNPECWKANSIPPLQNLLFTFYIQAHATAQGESFQVC